MRSRAEGAVASDRGTLARIPTDDILRVGERVARTLALLLIALGIWRAFTAASPHHGPVRVEGALRPSLAELSAWPASAVHVALARTPGVVERDWLVALRRAGTPVTWNDAGLAPPVALGVSRSADPAGAVTIAVATLARADSAAGAVARDSTSLRIADALGPIDSITAGPPGARITAPAVQGRVRAEQGTVMVASASAPPPRVLRPLLAVGSAGWEAKFVIAALEERGWIVHARMRVSPTATVAHVTELPIDTASYSAILLLDSAAMPAPASLVRYVRAGGGLVLAGNAARHPALAAIAPARAGAPIAGSLLRSASASGRAGLPAQPLGAVRRDAVEMERRDGHLVVAARREGAGRVISVGETESWRWRMSGDGDAPAEHRQWWSRIVASVAYAPMSSIPSIDPEAASFAALIHALGAPVARPGWSPRPATAPLPWWMGAGILALLVAEWASRRLRGDR